MRIKKHHLFDKELSYIKDDNKRKFCELCLDGLPEYFWSIPASSTGKYHPSYTIGEGGLARHVQGAMRIAIELFRCESCFNLTEEDKDDILIALSLHDGLKSGSEEDYAKSKYTKHNHPILSAKYVQEVWKNNQDLITKEDTIKIAKLIGSHMGQWNTNKYSSIVLPTPSTSTEKFVHLVDYLASRKCLELNFESGLSY